MNRSFAGTFGPVLAMAIMGGTVTPVVCQAEDKVALLGYGVKSCDDFIQAWNEREEGVDRGIAEYRRYEDWLSGFVSGLNLATGQDVLRGAQIEGAMRRAQVHCENKRKDDFFTATMDLVKLLSQLR